MVAYEFDDDYRLIDPLVSDDFFDVYDQIEFENSMESVDEMIRNGEHTMIY